MKSVLSVFALIAGLTALAAPAHAARVFVGVGVGGPAYYAPYPYPYYGYPYYAPPPTVVYAPPPTYVAPPQTVVYATPPVAAVNPASPTFTNEQGQTCREYQSSGTVGGSPQQTYGTACLQPDGSWRITQ